jgi:hypothetical protein
VPNADVLWPAQVSIYTKLTGDATLAGKVSGVFDHVPESQAFPYVVVGEATSTPQGAHDRFGARTTVTLHVWSAYHGFSEALAVVDDLMRLLDHQTLAIGGHHTVAVRHQQTVTMRDPDADLRHVAVRFAIETEHTDAA